MKRVLGICVAALLLLPACQPKGKDVDVEAEIARNLADGDSNLRNNKVAEAKKNYEVVLGYVGAAATKSVLLGLIILATAAFFVPLTILHPAWMVAFMLLTAVTFSLFGFIVGIWAKNWEQMQLVPMLIVTPLTFLGGAFYSIDMLPDGWRTVALFNPVVYLISGFRWSFFGTSDVPVGLSLGMTLVFMLACVAVIAWIFRTGYRLRS